MTRGARHLRAKFKSAGIDELDLGTVVLSTRIRLARNVADTRFPDWCTQETMKAVYDRIAPLAKKTAEEMFSGQSFEAHRLDDDDNANSDYYSFLREENVISEALISHAPDSGFVASFDSEGCMSKDLVIMVNEEDHIRIQSFSPVYDLHTPWTIADEFDTKLETRLPYAFNKRLGYLTACPSNLGTGLRASVMLTLPALLVIEEFDSVCRAVDRLGFNARGMNGEGSASTSGVVQISNRGTLGLTEKQVIASLKNVVDEVIAQEKRARLFLLRKMPVLLNDYLARSLAQLQNARLISSQETYDALTAVRLGLEIGAIAGLPLEKLTHIFSQTGHSLTSQFMRASGYKLDEIVDQDTRDAFRAFNVREMTSRAKFTPWLDEKWEK